MKTPVKSSTNTNVKKANSLAVVILAAGKGTRMKSDLPKVMHRIAGRPMINWIIDAAEGLKPDKIIVVTAPGMDDVKAAAHPYDCVIQKTQKGTGDAVKPALPFLKNFKGKVLVLLGDEPFLNKAVLKKMAAQDGLAVMAVRPQSTKGLGRMVVRDDGTLDTIVEEKDCTLAQKKINLCNAGNFCVPAQQLPLWLGKLRSNNKQKEYYLTDLPYSAKKDGFQTHVVEVKTACGWGINTRGELAAHEKVAQDNLRQKVMAGGATLIDPASVYLSADTKIGRDVLIEPNVFIGNGVKIGNGAVIHAFSHIEGAEIEGDAEVGPYARIRPKSIIRQGACVGNFIEVNRSIVGKGAKSKHMSYFGDTEIGEKANIGAGTVIANYDGFQKHKTFIGKKAFIGTNSTVVAPVTIGAGAMVAAGSTVTKDTPKNAMAIGRARQENYAGWAHEYRKVKEGKR
jgi:bifunctional UDP-N-acetylglucosamine pyrophosphorylase/glucosamine-1-phosphate N-acetyltransferase